MVVLTLPAPAMALTVTTPSLPAPLPAALPLADSTLSGSVSGGADGAPIAVTVTGPASTGVEIQVPPLPNLPALPSAPTLPIAPTVTDPISPSTPAPLPTAPSAPARAASPSHVGGTDPPAAVLNDRPQVPRSRFAAGAARPVAAPAPARPGRVSAAIDTRPADSMLHRIPGIASRMALWALLAAVVFVLKMLVASAATHFRRRPAPLS
jgi:hypothetical protein